MTDYDLPMSTTPNVSNTPHLRFLKAVRAHELRLALTYFPASHSAEGKKRTVLEIGAGTGQQAKLIESKGYEVVAIDLPSSHYRNDRVYDVVDYDGHTIPMQDHTADVVFSSNVLEHVSEIDSFLEETCRVMTKGGVAVHILPSSTCRLWSIPAHYIWLAKRLYARMASIGKRGAVENSDPNAPRMPRSAKEWLGTFFPFRHGERGVTLTEAYYFSRFWWRKKFRQHGFEIERLGKNELFYTMANALTDAISIETRAKLSRSLGSSCHIYVLKRNRE